MTKYIDIEAKKIRNTIYSINEKLRYHKNIQNHYSMLKSYWIYKLSLKGIEYKDKKQIKRIVTINKNRKKSLE